MKNSRKRDDEKKKRKGNYYRSESIADGVDEIRVEYF